MRTTVSIALIAILGLAGPSAAADPVSPRTRAIDKGLAYLKSTQAADGSWSLPRPGKSTAGTSFAVLAFLSAGHRPDKGPHGAGITRGIRWVMEKQKPSGLLGSESHMSMYEHGIATLMLAEAASLGDKELARDIRKKLDRAVNLILQAQKRPRFNAAHRGGWRYMPSSADSDLSVTGWQVLALCAARKAGCEVPQEALDQATAFVRRCRDPRSGGFTYQPNTGPTLVCTAEGVLALCLCTREGKTEEDTLRAVNYLVKRDAPKPAWFENYRLEMFYLASFACKQAGEEKAKTYRKAMHDLLLSRQANDGSWLGPTSEATFGRSFSTALAVLALTAEDRQLPLFQADRNKEAPADR